MRFLVGFSLLIGAFALTPFAPSIFGFPPSLTIDAIVAGGPLLTTSVPGGVVCGRFDLAGTSDLGSLTAQNTLRSLTVSFDIPEDRLICRDASLTIPFDVDVITDGVTQSTGVTSLANLQLITGDQEGLCRLTITAEDSLRLISTFKIIVSVAKPPVRDCVLGDTFEPFGPCTTVDGVEGSRISFRTIILDAVGKKCDRSSPFNNRKISPDPTCPKINCVLSATNEVASECNCTTFKKTFTQAIQTEAYNGGTRCPQPRVRIVDCVDTCPVNCALSNFSPFSSCSATCGGGVQTRTRTITKQAQNGGAPCVGLLTQTQACNTQPCPIDCVVGFTPFSACSAPCAGGIQTRKQFIQTQAAFGGQPCPLVENLNEESQACNTQTCPIETCKNRCGFIGASRGGLRDGAVDANQNAQKSGTDEQAESDQAEGSEKQFGFFGPVRLRRVFVPVRVSTEIPKCSCDALCARAIKDVNTCCSDIATECPRIRVLPPRNATSVGVLPVNPLFGCVFRSGPSFACPDIPLGKRGFFKNCVECQV